MYSRRVLWRIRAGVMTLVIALAGPLSAKEAVSLRDDIAPIPARALPGPTEASEALAMSYDNLSGDQTVYYAGQGGHEALDDLHAVQAGDVAEVTFRYYDPGTPASPTAYVTLYTNPSGLDAGAQVVAGPVVVGGLVSGVLGTAQALFPGSALVGADLWVGVRFSSDTAGLVISESPTLGTSHDYYREDGSLFYFGGSPVANFSIRVQVTSQVGVGDEPQPTPARLSVPWPNPMVSRASVLMSLKEPEAVHLAVYDLRGRLVTVLAEGSRPAGTHSLVWDRHDREGREAPAGIYFFRLTTRAGTVTRRIVALP